MAGNVEEFVSDIYEEGYYARSPVENPTGPMPSPKSRGHRFYVTRGGSMSLYQGYCGLRAIWSEEVAVDMKTFNDPNQGDGSGFRVVKEVEHKSKP